MFISLDHNDRDDLSVVQNRKDKIPLSSVSLKTQLNMASSSKPS